MQGACARDAAIPVAGGGAGGEGGDVAILDCAVRNNMWAAVAAAAVAVAQLSWFAQRCPAPPLNPFAAPSLGVKEASNTCSSISYPLTPPLSTVLLPFSTTADLSRYTSTGTSSLLTTGGGVGAQLPCSGVAGVHARGAVFTILCQNYIACMHLISRWVLGYYPEALYSPYCISST